MICSDFELEFINDCAALKAEPARGAARWGENTRSPRFCRMSNVQAEKEPFERGEHLCKVRGTA